jgi:hypothetical protein
MKAVYGEKVCHVVAGDCCSRICISEKVKEIWER